MVGKGISHEKRRTMRVRSKGAVRLHHRGGLIRGRVIDLAGGGVGLQSELAIESDLVGRAAQIELRFDADATARHWLRGHITRADVPTRTIGIELEDVPGEFLDCVRAEFVAATAHDALPHVILVDVASARRGAIATAFRGGGCDVTEVSTPLEAIAQLGRSRFEPGVIAIADTLPESVAENLRDYLRGEHPDAHMVAIGKSSLHRDPSGSWLSSADATGDLDIRVGRLITAHAGRSPGRNRHAIRPASRAHSPTAG